MLHGGFFEFAIFTIPQSRLKPRQLPLHKGAGGSRFANGSNHKIIGSLI